MKSLAVCALVALGGCAAIPGFDDPRVTLQPELHLLRLRGKTRMQSASQGRVVNNAAMDLRAFGMGSRDDDFGAAIALGDGFSGLDLSYFKLDMSKTATGTLSADWGALRRGDEVQSKAFMDEFRLRYVAQLLEQEVETDFDSVRFQLGVGALLAHRDASFEGKEISDARTQEIHLSDDGVPYGAVRARVSFLMLAGQVDYAYNPDVDFGGDFDGDLQDLELKLSFTFEDQDLTVFAGYRRQELPSAGHEGPFAFENDLVLDGYTLGLTFRF